MKNGIEVIGFENKKFWLQANHNKIEENNGVLFWGGHEYFQWQFNDDCTLSPKGNNKLVVG